MFVLCVLVSIAIHNVADSFAAYEQTPCPDQCPNLFVQETLCACNRKKQEKTFGSQCDVDYFNCHDNAGCSKFVTNYIYGSCVNKDGCTRDCNFKTRFVCASNGYDNQTFSSPCKRNNFNCQIKNSSQQYKPIKNGPCDSDNNTECPEFCTEEYLPLCGVDEKGNEKTFGNKCELKRANCPTLTYVIKQNGTCDNESSGNTTCDQQVCPAIYQPVCAEDKNGTEKTFSNNCTLDAANCKENEYTFKSNGTCQGANGPCAKFCPRDYKPVCCYKPGTGNVTFSNNCTASIANCTENGSYTFVSNGPCETSPSCPQACTKIYAPVCGSDGKFNKTFSNDCEMARINCSQNKTSFNKLYDGPCEFDCSTNCSSHPKEVDYVCAANSKENKTFTLPCDLVQEICKGKEDGYTYSYPGKCDSDNVNCPPPPPVQAPPAEGPPEPI